MKDKADSHPYYRRRKEYIIHQHLLGFSFEQIAKELQLTASTVKEYLRNRGYVYADGKWVEDIHDINDSHNPYYRRRKEYIINRYLRGHSPEDIAKVVRLEPNTIKNYLRQWGIDESVRKNYEVTHDNRRRTRKEH